MDTDRIQALFDRIDPPLWLVTARAGGERAGLIATFVHPFSIVPELPRMVLGLARHHHTWGVVNASRACALHLLGPAQREWVWPFGTRSGHDGDKFAGLGVAEGETGSPLLEGAVGRVECRVEGELPCGDRSLFLLQVVAGGIASHGTPLTVRQLLAGATPAQSALLRDQLAADAVRDAEAIRIWRSTG